MSRILVLAFLFFIGCVMGWEIELFFRRFFSKNNPEKKWINPGFLVGPWLPLYGLGLIGMYTISIFLSQQEMTGIRWMDTVVILVIMTFLMTVIELIAGLIFTRFFNVKLWDYKEEKFNFKGLICPKFSLMWGVLGCFYYFVINPYVLEGIIWLSQHLTFSFFIGMFFGVLGGSMIIEQIFSIPGVGQLYIKSISLFDYDVFMLDGIFYTFLGLVAGIVIDLSYGFIDPRIRMGE